jgi:hypothetical protein
MPLIETAVLEIAELKRELTMALDSCKELRREMREAELAGENLVDLNALLWLPPFVSFWVESGSPLLKFNPRTGKFEPFQSHL